VDTLGLILGLKVHTADVQDRDGARLLLTGLENSFGWLKRHRWIKLDIVRRCDKVSGFKILPKRWIVERTFGWLSKFRRLSKDYETSIESSEALIYIAMSRIMVARLAR